MKRTVRLVAVAVLVSFLGGCSGEEPEKPAQPAQEPAPEQPDNPKPASKDLQLALDAALKKADFAAAAKAIEAGADVDAPDDDGNRLIHAVANRYVYADPLAAAKFLKERGADLTTPNPKAGWPPIADAVWWGRIDLMEFFVENGADVKAVQPGPIHRSKPGYTLLHIAALNSNPRPVAWLLDKGLDVNAKNSEGDTALLLAAFKGNSKVAGVLLERGADKSVVGSDEKTARQLAAEELERVKNDRINRVRIEELMRFLDAG